MNKRILTVPALALLALIGIFSASGARAQGQDPAPKTALGSQDCPPAWRVVPGASGTSGGGGDVISALSPDDVWVLLGSTGIQHWNGSSWAASYPNVPSSIYALYGIGALSDNDVWVVGFYMPGACCLFENLVMHYDGLAWSLVPTPHVAGQPSLYNVSIVSRNDVWFAGYPFFGEHPLIMHYDGTSVSLVPSPDIFPGGVFLLDIVALSHNDAWAVGYYGDPNDFIFYTLTEHWNGTAWSVVPSPNIAGNSSILFGLSAVSREDDSVSSSSRRDIWAVGLTCVEEECFDVRNHPLALHYDGRAWSMVPAPDLSPNYGVLKGVAAISRNDAWIVGSSNDSSGNSQALTEHWNGHEWSIVSSPSPNPGTDSLVGVSATSRDDRDREGSRQEVWAAGTFVERYSTSCR